MRFVYLISGFIILIFCFSFNNIENKINFGFFGMMLLIFAIDKNITDRIEDN